MLLFDYLPKPIILKNLSIDLNYTGLSTGSPEIRSVKLKSGIEEDLIMKTKNVQRAYTNICSKSEMTPLDLKLVDMLDENMKNILNFDKGLESPSIIRNFTKEEIILKSPEQKQSMDSGDGRNFTTMQNLTLNKC